MPELDRAHCMDLHDYARLAGLREYPTPDAGALVVLTPALADALDALIEAADELAPVAGPLADALAVLRARHDYQTVRLGGARR